MDNAYWCNPSAAVYTRLVLSNVMMLALDSTGEERMIELEISDKWYFFCHRSANSSRLTLRGGEEIFPPLKSNISSIWKLYRKKDTNLLKELRVCRAANRSNSLHVELSCSNYGNIQFNNYFQLAVLSKVLCLNTLWGYRARLFIHLSIFLWPSTSNNTVCWIS